MAPGSDGRDWLDVPYEEQDRTEVDLSDGILAGGVVVMGAVLDVEQLGPQPAIVLRFRLPDGGFHRPIVLVQDARTQQKLVPLFRAAIDSAVRAAHRTRRAQP